jgi:hypothetical protein
MSLYIILLEQLVRDTASYRLYIAYATIWLDWNILILATL